MLSTEPQEINTWSVSRECFTGEKKGKSDEALRHGCISIMQEFLISCAHDDIADIQQAELCSRHSSDVIVLLNSAWIYIPWSISVANRWGLIAFHRGTKTSRNIQWSSSTTAATTNLGRKNPFYRIWFYTLHLLRSERLGGVKGGIDGGMGVRGRRGTEDLGR